MPARQLVPDLKPKRKDQLRMSIAVSTFLSRKRAHYFDSPYYQPVSLDDLNDARDRMSIVREYFYHEHQGRKMI